MLLNSGSFLVKLNSIQNFSHFVCLLLPLITWAPFLQRIGNWETGLISLFIPSDFDEPWWNVHKRIISAIPFTSPSTKMELSIFCNKIRCSTRNRDPLVVSSYALPGHLGIFWSKTVFKDILTCYSAQTTSDIVVKYWFLVWPNFGSKHWPFISTISI